MKLEVESGRKIQTITEEEILTCLEEELFTILSRGAYTYLQCAAREEDPFEYILEYQEGSLDRHYQAIDQPITLERVMACFVKYLNWEESWKDDFEWELIDLS